MCTSGSWKDGSKLSHLWKSDAEHPFPDSLWTKCILIVSGPSLQVKEGLDIKTVRLMRVMSQNPY